MKLTEEWLWKAQRDYDAAVLLMSGKYFDSTVFHTQQCAEKALKGYLSMQNQAIIKTHDLDLLLEKCKIFDSTFGQLEYFTSALNNFDTLFRYPSSSLEPEESEAQEAILCSEKILVFVIKKCNKS